MVWIPVKAISSKIIIRFDKVGNITSAIQIEHNRGI